MADDVRLRSVPDAGREWPALVWHAPPGWRAISSGVIGGGLGPVDAWINVMVSKEYFEPDPMAHVWDLASRLGVHGRVAGMITAADVRRWQRAEDGGARVAATVGLGWPTLAAAPGEGPLPSAVGTINLLVVVPVPLSDAALVNLVVTATEAKAQALSEAGFDATGTASDAVCLACPEHGEHGSRAEHGEHRQPGRESGRQSSRESGRAPGEVIDFDGVELYGGPRSRWGARVARAVHRAVLAGAQDWRATHAGS